MSWLAPRFQALAVLAACASVAAVTPLPVAVVALLLGLIPVFAGPRLELDRVAQAALTIVGMVAGVLVPRLSPVPESNMVDYLLTDRSMLLVMPMLGVASARSVMVKPIYGARLTMAAVLVALTGAGRAQVGWVYPICFGSAMAFALLALREADPTRAPRQAMGRKQFLFAGLMVLASGGLTATFALTLPRLHEAMMARVMERLDRQRLGFSDNMVLGAMSGLLESDTVVMRVRGNAPSLLRGVVLVRYAAGRWESLSEAPLPEVIETAVRGDRESSTEIEHAGTPKRYFLPLGAEEVRVSAGIYERDAFYLGKPPLGFPAKRVWFKLSQTPGAGPALDPQLEDLQFPQRLSGVLLSTLREFSVSEVLPARERAARIEQHLSSSFRYSLDFDRDSRLDPVEDFLAHRREGHCEYFASTMVLLLRAARVPARVVAGYRVVEESPLGYHVVRERNAHSWVEAWIDERWVTFDPTPAADLALASPARTPSFSALWDALATGWEATDDWLAARTPFELSLIVVGLVGIWISLRTLRGRAKRVRPEQDPDAPLPAFVTLDRKLHDRGVGRRSSETLDAYLARLPEAGVLDPLQREGVREALLQYASLRYARRGNEETASASMTDAANRL